MGTPQVERKNAENVRHLRDVSHGQRPSRLRLLAPLRYLAIENAEKARYDFRYPVLFGVMLWLAYWAIVPKVPIFGDDGILRFARDLLIMAVPFLIGSLGVVATGLPGDHFDERLKGVDLRLDGRPLTLRRFVCYQLGYLCFLGMLSLALVVASTLMHDTVTAWVTGKPVLRGIVEAFGTLVLSLLLSALSVTTLWSLYFLTDVVNDTD